MPTLIQPYAQQTVPQGTLQARASVMDVSSGLQDLAQGVQNVSTAFERKAQSDFQLKASKAALDADLQWDEWGKTAADNWKRGDMALPDQFIKTFDDWAKKSAENLKAPNAELQNRLDLEFHRLRAEKLRQLVNWQAKQNAALVAQDVGEMGDIAAKLAYDNPAKAEILTNRIAASLDGVQMSPAEREEATKKARNVIAYSAEIGAIDRMQNGGERWKVDDKRFSWNELTPKQRDELLTHAHAVESRIEGEARARRAEAQNNALIMADNFTKSAESGFLVSPADMESARTAAKLLSDSPVGKRLQSSIDNYSAITAFSQRPMNEQADILKSAYVDAAKGNADAAYKFSMLKKAYDNNEAMFKDNPFDLYSRLTGKPIAPVDSIDPVMLGQQMEARKEANKAVAAFFGRQTPLLSKREAASIAGAVQGADVSNQIAWIESIPPESRSLTLANIGETAPMLQVAGMADADRAKSILAGQKILDSKTFEPKGSFGKKFDQAFSGHFSDVFGLENANEINVAKQVVQAAYAYESIKANKTDGTTFDPAIMQKALKAAGDLHSFNGRKTFVPVGMDSDEFDDKAKAELSKVAKKLGLNDVEARNFSENVELVSRSNYQYQIYKAGAPVAGAPIITIDPNNDEPVLPIEYLMAVP